MGDEPVGHAPLKDNLAGDESAGLEAQGEDGWVGNLFK